MSEWRRYTAFQKAKRKGKKTGEESTVAEEIVVQRMSAEVSGKQQKYTRIGPQEYVPFEHEEITIEGFTLEGALWVIRARFQGNKAAKCTFFFIFPF